MKEITKDEKIKNLPGYYKRQYPKNYPFMDGTWSDDKLKLLENESGLSESMANEIIGNSSWTHNLCNECGEDKQIVIQLGEEPDYESQTANICLDCLQAAIVLIEHHLNQSLQRR